jgi:hypothetical protein
MPELNSCKPVFNQSDYFIRRCCHVKINVQGIAWLLRLGTVSTTRPNSMQCRHSRHCRLYAALLQGSGDMVARLRAPPTGPRQQGGALQGPRAGFGAPVQYSGTVHKVDGIPLVSARTVSLQRPQEERPPLSFPMQCTCTSFGPCCAALAREGVLFPATYTFARGRAARKGDRVTVTGIRKSHDLLWMHAGACPGTFGAAATEGQGEEEHWLDLCLPGGHPGEQPPLLEDTILVACDDSRGAAPDVQQRGAARGVCLVALSYS